MADPNGTRPVGYRGKRAFDLAVAIPALVVTSPVMPVVALLVKLSSRGPILFRQERIGCNGRRITIYKFRTMTTAERANAEVYPGTPGVTPIGAILRRLKIDELPQLFNILIGDMSIVGPRPGLPGQTAGFTPIARRRLAVRPGLTGLAQINGNIYLSWPERWQYDAAYVDAMSLALDVKIVVRTLGVVILGEKMFRRTAADG